MSAGRRTFFRILRALLIAYMAVVAGMFFAQRSLMYPAPARVAGLPAGFERVGLTTADGLRLAAAWRPPAKGKPSLVFFHGNGDSWTGAAAATAKFAEAGFGVLLPEYRGYGGNPGKPDEAGLYADGRAAISFLKSRNIAGAQLAIAGNSIGSGVAVQMARETPAAALILISPFTAMTDLVAERFRWLPGRWLVRDRYENRSKIGDITAPILIMHGKADRVIPFGHAKRLARANRKAELILDDTAGHELAYRESARLASLDWLHRQLAGK